MEKLKFIYSLPLKNIIENYCKPTWTKIEGLPVYEKPK